VEPIQRWWSLPEPESVDLTESDADSDTDANSDTYTDAYSNSDAVTVAEPIGFTDDAVQLEHVYR
jgi:hypothetical protein